MLKTLSRYLVVEFAKLLLLCQAVFLSIYLIFDFLLKIDNFIEAGAGADIMVSYFLFKTPFVLVQMLPPAILVSIILLYSLMKRRNEFTAIKACGLDIYKVSVPVLVFSALVGLALFMFSELVVPYTSTRYNEVWDVEVEKRDPAQIYGTGRIWYKGQNRIYKMMEFDYKHRRMVAPTLYFFDESFRLTKRIDARTGTWDHGAWRFESGILQEHVGGGEYEISRFKRLVLDLEEIPETFTRRERSPEEMSYWELKGYAERVGLEGYDNTKYLVDLNFKLAFPLITVVMVLIGISLALNIEQGGIPFVVLLGICICFLYTVTLLYSRYLGFAGVLPPFLSAWLANLTFSFFGIYLFMKVER